MADTADYLHGEPAPINQGDSPSMHDLAAYDVIDFDHFHEDIRKKLIALLKERKAYGLAKYGTILQAHNGRNAVNDLVDELLDAIVYNLQAITEEDVHTRKSKMNALYHVYRLVITAQLTILRMLEEEEEASQNDNGRDSEGLQSNRALDGKPHSD